MNSNSFTIPTPAGPFMPALNTGMLEVNTPENPIYRPGVLVSTYCMNGYDLFPYEVIIGPPTPVPDTDDVLTQVYLNFGNLQSPLSQQPEHPYHQTFALPDTTTEVEVFIYAGMNELSFKGSNKMKINPGSIPGTDT